MDKATTETFLSRFKREGAAAAQEGWTLIATEDGTTWRAVNDGHPRPAQQPPCQQCKEPGDPPHTCPYAEDIGGDYDTLCSCCDQCADECARSV